MLQSNSEINDFIVAAHANNVNPSFALGDISDVMAEALSIATSEQDAALNKMLLSYFNQKIEWSIMAYETESDYDKARGDSIDVDFYHEAADTDTIIKLFVDNEVIKIRTDDGEESMVYKKDDWEIKLLMFLESQGIYASISIAGEIILIGVRDTNLSDIIEAMASGVFPISVVNGELNNLTAALKSYGAKINRVDGFIAFSRI